MRHNAEYETTDVIDMVGARPWARLVGSTAELSLLSDHAKMVGRD